MAWDEFLDLLAGLGPDTPLGRIVSIRATKQEDVKNLSPDALRIYNDWQLRKYRNKSEEEVKEELKEKYKDFTDMLKKMK